MHFLLVEDNPAHAKLIMMQFLGRRDVTIDRVADGDEALQYVRGEAGFTQKPRPDLVLLDLNLPRMDGHEVLQELKGDPDLRSIPVVVLTTSQNDRDLARAYHHHANSYLVKPYEFEQFRRMMSDLCAYWCKWHQRLQQEFPEAPAVAHCATAATSGLVEKTAGRFADSNGGERGRSMPTGREAQKVASFDHSANAPQPLRVF